MSGVFDYGERSDNPAEIRLYKFSIGQDDPGGSGTQPSANYAVWAYTDGDRDLSYGGTSYQAIAIGDDGLKQKGDATTDDFVITLPSSMPLVRLFRGTPPSQPIKAELRMLHMPTDGGYGDAPLMWFGYVSSVKYRDEIVSTVLCNTQAATLNRKGLRLAWERQCPHALYDSQCRVPKDQWGVPAVISTLTHNAFGVTLPRGGLIPANGQPMYDWRFQNGFVEWRHALGFIERRAILAAIEGGFLLLGQTDGLSIGQDVVLYPGCRRTPADCRAFNNIANYGGFAFLPGKSPFDGTPVF